MGRYNDFSEALEQAVEGCRGIISCMGQVRFAKWTDFLPWRYLSPFPQWAGRDHPYYGNYRAQERLMQLAKQHKIQRFVRLTGLGLAYSPFNPFSILFNTLLSHNNRWGILCEQALADSGVPYVVLRPGGLAEDARDTHTTNLQVDPSGILPFPGRVGRADVASLLIESVLLPSDAPNYTLACRWCGEGVKPKPQGHKTEGYETAHGCMQQLVASGATSPGPPPTKPYRLAVGLAVYPLMFLSAKLSWAFLKLMYRIMVIRG